MKFECISSSINDSQYSLHDYSENPFGETIMSIEFHHKSKNWWFVGKPKNVMNKEHMKALCQLLDELLKL